MTTSPPRRAPFLTALIVIVAAAFLSTAAVPASALPASALPGSVVQANSVRVATVAVAPNAAAVGRSGSSAVTHRWRDGSEVTIAQTTNLIHQVVRVSWTGRRPTTYVGSIDNGGGSTNGVDVLQCWGLHPRREDCWYAPATMAQPYRADYTAYTSWTVPGDPAEVRPYRDWWTHQLSPPFITSTGSTVCAQYGCAHDIAGITAAPDFTLLPTNEQLGQTSRDGTGSVGFEVRSRNELPSLGCDATHPCSVVVIPTDHPVTGPAVSGSDSAASTEFAFRFTASHWADRAVFPLHFAAQSATCPFTSDQTQVTASEAAAAAIVRWQPALCTRGIGGVRVGAALTTEPDSIIRSQLAAGLIPLGVLNRPVTTVSAHPLTAAPVVASGAAISFTIDDARTGAPVRTLNLNARVVAKLLTESYCSFVCGTNPSYPANPNVAGNPELVWQDPELAALNPGVTFFTQGAYAPEMEYFDSDAFYTLTRWVNADPTARAWLDGTPDRWGMRVNTRYRHWRLPVSAPVKLDPWKVPTANPRCVPASVGACVYNGQDLLDLKYQFLNSMDIAAQNVTVGQSSDASNSQPDPNHAGKTVFAKVASAAYPNRAVLGVMTTSQAATLGLPMASLRNASGQFIAPTAATLGAGMAAMAYQHTTGTYDLDPAARRRGIYPLTMIQSIIAPTAGLSKPAAGKVAAIIRYATGPGQIPGTGLGQLPAGYIPVTPVMAKQAVAAAAAVAAQTGGPSPAPTPAPPRRPAPAPAPHPVTAPPRLAPGPAAGLPPALAAGAAAVTGPRSGSTRSAQLNPGLTVPGSGLPTPTPPPLGARPVSTNAHHPAAGAALAGAGVGASDAVAAPPAGAAGVAVAGGAAAAPVGLGVSNGSRTGQWVLAWLLGLGVVAGLAAAAVSGTPSGRRALAATRLRLGALRPRVHP